MPLYLKSLDPSIDVLGDEQKLNFNKKDPTLNKNANLKLVNYANTSALSNSTSLSLITSENKGYKFNQVNSMSDEIGNFYLEKIDGLGGSDNIFYYDNTDDKVKFLKEVEFKGGGGEGVTSVGIKVNAGIEVENSPITSTGDMTLTLKDIPASTIENYPNDSTKYLDGEGNWSVPSGGGGSGVTSVGIAGGTGINVEGSPITSSGTMDISLSPELEKISSFSETGLVERTDSENYRGIDLIAGDNVTITEDETTGNKTISASGGGGGDITLKGAVTGTSVGGVVDTKISNVQTYDKSVIESKWEDGVVPLEGARVVHSLPKIMNGNSQIGILDNDISITTDNEKETFINQKFVINTLNNNMSNMTYSMNLHYNINNQSKHIQPFKIHVEPNVENGEHMFIYLPIHLNQKRIKNLGNPIESLDAATKQYVDNAIAHSGGPVGGALFNLTHSSTSYLLAGDHCPFNNISFRHDPLGLITLSTASYTRDVGVRCLGRVSLKKGYIYKMSGFVKSFSSTSYFGFSFYDVTSDNTQFGTKGSSFAATNQSANADSILSTGYIKTDIDRLIELRLTGGSIAQWYVGNVNYGECWLDVQVIGKL